ncbi:MAG TPA: BatD family protein [Myxococcales bacterium]|nr:BatD family protein [Myxococcales bacterium]
MSRRTGSAIAVLLVASAALAAEDVQVSARTDADEVALDGTLNLQITAVVSSKGDQAELTLPDLKDFDVVSRSQSEQVAFTFLNGAPTFRRTTVTTVKLAPRREGQLKIEPARVNYKGRAYTTQPISIRALAPGQTPAPKARAQAGPPPPLPDPFAEDGSLDPFQDMHPQSRDLVLRASIDRERPFVGQQVTYSLYLLARINVSGIDKLQLPRLDGFWSEEIEAPQQLVGEARIIDGVPYRAFLLRKRALFPLRPGKVQIDPAEVEVMTGFGMLFSRSSTRRASQPVTVDVQPLPDARKPAGFDAGNVGSWTLTASVDPVAVAVGQPVTFKLVAQGRGNVRNLALPKLGQIPGLRSYDATSNDKESIEQGQVTGTRTVEQLLVPERTGAIEIPSLAMDVFDPAQKSYRGVRTDPIRLDVHAGPANASSGTQVPAQNLLAAGGLRPIRLRMRRASVEPPPWTEGWFWPLLAAGPVAVAAVAGAGRVRRALARDPAEERVKKARSAARARLRGAEALLEEQRRGNASASDFHAEVARALTGYLADKQGIAVAGLTREELGRELLARGHLPGTVRAVLGVLDECDRARFAPGGADLALQEARLERAGRLLGELDKARRNA